MANGYGNIVGRRRALNLTPLREARAARARRRPPRVRVRAKRDDEPTSREGGGRNPGGSNVLENAELQELGIRAATESEGRSQARQRAIETRNMQDARLRDLAQTARGESPAQMEAGQRRVAMQEQRDAEQEKRRFRATAQVGSLLDQRYEELRKEGEVKLQGKELAGLTDMIPGWAPKIDSETGKPRPVYVREEPSGEPGSEEIVFGFYEEDVDGNRIQIRSGRGEPVRPNRGVMARLAQMNEMDRRERSGIPGRARATRAAEAGIAGTEARATRDLAEAQYALAGKPSSRTGTQFTEKDRRKALLDTQDAYADLLASEQEYAVAGTAPPPELTALKTRLEEQMNVLSRPTEQAVPVQGAPATTARPRARNPQTGEVIEWDGRQWVPAQ